MAKYLEATAAGVVQEVQPVNTSAGAGDAAKIPELDAAGKLDASMIPAGFGGDVETVVASENLAANDLVNIWDDAGTRKMRKADASLGRLADGFVLAAVIAAASGSCYMDGTITGMTGLTIGSRYFLSGAAAGTATLTAPTTSTHHVQDVGKAISATELSFEPGRSIIRV